MLVTGTNVLYISFMIMFCFIKILMTDTSYEKSDRYIINSILIGFIFLTFIETIVIFIVGNNKYYIFNIRTYMLDMVHIQFSIIK